MVVVGVREIIGLMAMLIFFGNQAMKNVMEDWMFCVRRIFIIRIIDMLRFIEQIFEGFLYRTKFTKQLHEFSAHTFFLINTLGLGLLAARQLPRVRTW
jgi:hypothetical protein